MCHSADLAKIQCGPGHGFVVFVRWTRYLCRAKYNVLVGLSGVIMRLDPACGDPLISCNILMPLEEDECVFQSRANYGSHGPAPTIVPRFGG